MYTFANARHLSRCFRGAGSALTISAVLVGCGGGGGGVAAVSATVDMSQRASVTSATFSAPMYSQPLLLTVVGSHLDNGLAITATGCTGGTLSTTAPHVSSATTAYYQCNASSVGAGQFVATRTADATVLATQTFTVPMPQVTLTYSNGAAFSGSVVITLRPDKAPITVDNFLTYVKSGFYVDTVVHRIVPGAFVQAGGYAKEIVDASAALKSTRAPIALEVSNDFKNTQWTVAMVHVSDRSGAFVSGSTSQFFINLVDNPQIDHIDNLPIQPGYAVFGAVSAGTSVVTAMVAAPCREIPNFLFLVGATNDNGTPRSDCTPSPNVVITAAVQTQ